MCRLFLKRTRVTKWIQERERKRQRLRKRKKGQNWEDEWKKRAMWRSDGERLKSRETTCCCKVHIQSLIHISTCLHDISWATNAEIISVVCTSLASEQNVSMGLQVLKHIVRQRWCQEMIQRSVLAHHQTLEHIWCVYYCWKCKQRRPGLVFTRAVSRGKLLSQNI